MKAHISVIMAVLCLGILVGIVSGIPIDASVTEHSVIWTWQPGTEYMVYVDGQHTMNTTIGRFHLADLRPYEEHRIDLYLFNPDMSAMNETYSFDSPDMHGTLEGTSNVTTLSSVTTIYFILSLIAIFLFMGYAGRATVYGILMATMALIGSIYLIFIVPAYSLMFLMITLMFLVLSITVVVYDIHRLFIASEKGWYFS